MDTFTIGSGHSAVTLTHYDVEDLLRLLIEKEGVRGLMRRVNSALEWVAEDQHARQLRNAIAILDEANIPVEDK